MRRVAALTTLLLLATTTAAGQTMADALSQIKNLPAGGGGEIIIEPGNPQCPGPVLERTSDTVLTIGKAWTPTTPCVIDWWNGVTARLTRSYTVTLAPDYPTSNYGQQIAGAAHVYVSYLGQQNFRVAVAMRNPEKAVCNGCEFNTTLQNFPMFPGGTAIIGAWNIDAGSAPAKWGTGGFKLRDAYDLGVDEGLQVALELYAGRWSLRLVSKDDAAAAAGTTPPTSSTAPCTVGSVVYTMAFKYQCVHVREQYLIDGRVARWVRFPLESTF